MGEVFRLPKLGMDMEEGSVTSWLKAEGDVVKKGEPIAEIETDKTSVEVESPADGILLKQYYSEWEVVPCGTPIAYIGNSGEHVPDVQAADHYEASAVTPAAVSGTVFCLPKLGMDMEEGSVTSWLKAEGDAVKKGEPIAEIETDKTSVEVESPADGILLKQYYSEWEVVPCGTPVAFIGNADGPIPSIEEAAAWGQAAPITETVTEQTSELPAEGPVCSLTPGGRIRSSPRARRLAEQEQVDLQELTGSGEYGRITEQDVRDHLTAAIHPIHRIPSETVTPLTGVRKVTARRMMQSLTSTAQAQHRVDVDATALIAFRKQVNGRLEKSGIKVSFVDILIMACAKALIEHPMANAALMEDGLHLRNFANVGFAADTERGLVVPVVRDADVLSLPEIAKASRNLIEKAKTGKLQTEDMTGGTFTISNLGMYEIDSFTAVLNPPETCILAVGRIAERVVADQGKMVIRSMLNLSLTYDHQVLDGAPAARFLQSIKHYLENPVWLLM